MSVSNAIKSTFSNAFKELIKTTPVDKITIKQLCNYCDLGRQTFYNHFKDKFDLINWVYSSETANIFRDYKNDYDWEKVINKIFYHFLENKKFYQQVAKIRSQNSFSEFLVEHTREYYINAIRTRFAKEIIDCELLYTIEFNNYGAVNMSLKWIHNGMVEKPEAMAALMMENMPAKLKKYMTTL